MAAAAAPNAAEAIHKSGQTSALNAINSRAFVCDAVRARLVFNFAPMGAPSCARCVCQHSHARASRNKTKTTDGNNENLLTRAFNSNSLASARGCRRARARASLLRVRIHLRPMSSARFTLERRRRKGANHLLRARDQDNLQALAAAAAASVH